MSLINENHPIKAKDTENSSYRSVGIAEKGKNNWFMNCNQKGFTKSGKNTKPKEISDQPLLSSTLMNDFVFLNNHDQVQPAGTKLTLHIKTHQLKEI